MSVKPLNQRFALIVASYNCRKRDYTKMYTPSQVNYSLDTKQTPNAFGPI